MKRYVPVPTVLLILVFALPTEAQVRELLQEADRLMRRPFSVAKVKKIVETYKMVLALEPENFEAYWKVARGYYYIGEKARRRSIKKQMYREGAEYAKLAIYYSPNNPAGHFWLAVNYTLYGRQAGIFQSLALVVPIRRHLGKVIRCNPGFLEGAAYLVRGRMNYILNSKISGLKGATNEKAIADLEKAVRYGPERFVSHLFLAEAYVKAKKYCAAKKRLLHVIKGSCRKPRMDYTKKECRGYQKRARKMLKKLS